MLLGCTVVHVLSGNSIQTDYYWLVAHDARSLDMTSIEFAHRNALLVMAAGDRDLYLPEPIWEGHCEG
jgi:hypothetical protein